MISIEAQFSGGQIATALMSDAEELWYFLETLGAEGWDNLAGEVAEYAHGDTTELVSFLRLIATAIENETA